MTRPTAWRWARLAVLAAVTQGVVHVVGAMALDHGFLNVNVERRPFAAVGGLALGAATVGTVVAALRGVLPLVIAVPLAPILGFFAVDEVAGIHERFAAWALSWTGLSDTWDSVVWPILYLPLAGMTLVLLWRSAQRAPLSSAALVRCAMVLLVAAVGLEVVSAPFSTTADGIVHGLEGAVEEGFELTAWCFVAIAMLTWRAGPHVGENERLSRRAGSSAPRW